MKKLLVALLVLFPTICFAEPFLVCDPMSGAEQTQVVLDGTPQGWKPYSERDFGGQIYCVLMDLVGLSNGAHTVTAEADFGVWGNPGYSDPFEFVKPDLRAPQGFILIKEGGSWRSRSK